MSASEVTTNVAEKATLPLVVSLEDLSPEVLQSLEAQVKPKVFQLAVKEALLRMKEDNDLEIAKLKDKIIRDNEDRLQKHLIQFDEEEAKRRKPLTSEEIAKLLDQEYATFKVKVETDGETLEFTLRELPSYYEKKFFTLVKTTLKEAAEKFSGDSLKSIVGEDWVEKIDSILETVEPAFDVLKECVVICLNPKGEKGEHSFVTTEWVEMNLTVYRMTNIVKAQAELNKLRDFFFELFRGFLNAARTNPADVLQ